MKMTLTCSLKIAYYLEHDNERQAIAQAGYERTHAQHTYWHRMRYMLDRLAEPLFKPLAPMRQAGQHERWKARHEVYTHLHMLDAVLDASREMGHNPLQRAWYALPCGVRRLLF